MKFLLALICTLIGLQTQAFAATENEECLAHLKSVTCLSDKIEGGFDRNCSFKKITPQVLEQLPKLINLLPPIHKKVFCNLNRLQIQPRLSSIGYATFIPDEKDQVIGNMIGLRPDALAGHIPGDLWSWKEQLNFGLSDRHDATYTLSKDGPLVQERVPGIKNLLLLHVLIHELTHLLHTMNEYYWIADGAESDPWLSQLCYYECGREISPENIKDVYKALEQSTFVTPYSTYSNMEDFAEASTIFFLQKMNLEYKILGPDKSVLFDYKKVWAHPKMQPKIAQIKEFYSRKNLIYKVTPVPTADTGH